MPVRAHLVGNSIEVKITNSSAEMDDDRKRGPRYESLDRQATLALIKQLVSSLERLEARLGRAS